MPRGRSKKGGEDGVKLVEEESENPFQILEDLEELGYTKEEVVKLLMQSKDKGKRVETNEPPKEVESVSTPT